MSESKKDNVFIRALRFLFPWKGDSAGEVIRKLVFLVSVTALIVCGIYFVGRFSQRKAYTDTKKLSSLVGDSDETDEAGQLEKYADLKAINADFVAWLKIPGTGIDVPVVQAEDNEQYLRKDFYGEYSVYGNPFLDYRNRLDTLFRDGVCTPTVYGHNMLDNLVFAQVLQYKKKEFYTAHPVVELQTVYGDTKWKIIAAFLVNSTADMDNGYTLEYNFTNCSAASFRQYLEELYKRSYIHTGVDVSESDVLLTLSTCDKAQITEGRFVVVARLLRDGESEKIDAAKVSKNENIKFPQGYYDKYKMQNPYQNDARWKAE